VIGNPASPSTPLFLHSLEVAGNKLGLAVMLKPAANHDEIERALRDAGRDRQAGIVAPPDLLALAERKAIISLTAEAGIPAAYPFRQFARDRGLLSYSTNGIELFREGAIYVDAILRARGRLFAGSKSD
jgi:putative tryptophan/tyrosine transport system substrate-binding protein